MDVLGRASLTIDYRRSRVTIGPFGPLGHRAPLVRTSAGFAAVDVEVGGQHLRLVLDSGADGVLVFSAPKPANVIERDSVEAGGLWGVSRLVTARVRRINLAAWRLGTDTVAVADAAQATQAYDGDGLLGVRSLDASLVSLDFAHGELRWAR
jgi:hypothetical protein